MRAILVDADKQTIEEVDCPCEENREGFRAIQMAVGGTFDIVSLGKDGDLYVNGEALLSKPPPTKFFELPGYHTPLAGKGLFLASNRSGNTTPTKLTVEKVRGAVTFTTRDLLGFDESQGEIDHPVFGRAFVHSVEPKFSKPKT